MIIFSKPLSPKTTVQYMDFGFLNAQCVNTKASKIREHVTYHKLDILTITDTWKTTNIEITEVKPDDFSLSHYPKKDI